MNMSKKTFALALAVACAAVSSFAATYYVDANKGNDDWNGEAATAAADVETSKIGPKKTVQAAVDLADGTGTTVILAPGVYAEGGRENDNSWVHSNRVVITKSNVTVRSSTGKPEDVHIVGKLADTPDRMGSGAMRCMASNKNVANAVAVGITFRDGAGGVTGDAGDYHRGGGLLAVTSGGLTIVDCVVSNCFGSRGGGAYQIVAHSSRFTKNTSVSYGSAGCFCKFANCLIDHNGDETGHENPLGYVYALVNCTVAYNGRTKAALSSGTATGGFCANSIVFGQAGGNGDSTMDFYRDILAGSPASKSIDEFSLTGDAYRGDLLAPFLGDYHPVSVGDAIGLGDASYLSQVPLPEGFTYHDLDGNELPTEGAVNVGAYQAAVTPVAARIDFGDAQPVEVGGISRKMQSGEWLWPIKWPVTYKFKSDRPNLYALYAEESYDAEAKAHQYRYPQYDGWIDFTPPCDSNLVQTLKVQKWAGILYVNEKTGDDSWDGTASTPAADVETSGIGPKKTLQAAVDAVPQSFYILRVAPGDYREGGAVIGGCSNRVNVSTYSMALISDVKGGATIWGAPDPETQGLGDNATRCAYLAQKYAMIQGFVLTGGYTADTDTDSAGRGGGYRASSIRPHVLDCVISNNCAYVAAGGVYATAIRSIFVDNHTKENYVIRSGTLVSCVFRGNDMGDEKSSKHTLDSSTRAYGCTFDLNGYRPANGTWAYGCIFFNGNHITTFNNVGCVASTTGDDLWLADRSNGDYRLGVLSPAVNCSSRTDLLTEAWWQYLACDICGNLPVYADDGCRTAGAYLNDPLAMCVTDTTSDGRTATTNVVLTPAPVTVTAADWQTRPFLGFVVNGETQELVSASCTFTPVTDAGTLNTVLALYGHTWHVDCTKANDDDFGSTADHAFRRLCAAASRAVSGDVIRVAEGVYDEGEMRHTTPINAKSEIVNAARVVLAEGVTLESAEGAEKTLILGKAASEPTDDCGSGADAIRCIMAEENATIRGFTIANGRLQHNGTTYDDNTDGAGVLARNRTVTVADCIVSNNASPRAAFGYNCTFVRARIFANVGIERQPSRHCAFYGCVFEDNVAGCTEHFYAFDGCTVGRNNIAGKGGGACNELAYPWAPIVNTVFMGNRIAVGSVDAVFYATNCVFHTTTQGNSPDKQIAKENRRDCTFLSDLADFRVGEDLRPLPDAEGPIVDKVTGEYAAMSGNVGETDASGFQRVMNGVRDIGALEADWRPCYGRDIGGRAKVTEASPAVVEAEGKVSVPGGSRIAFDLNNRRPTAGEYRLSVAVGGGTLSVTLDGESVAFEDASDIRLAVEPGEHSIAVALAGEASDTAVIQSLRNQIGALLLVR